jgi:hypothetical protein
MVMESAYAMETTVQWIQPKQQLVSVAAECQIQTLTKMVLWTVSTGAPLMRTKLGQAFAAVGVPMSTLTVTASKTALTSVTWILLSNSLAFAVAMCQRMTRMEMDFQIASTSVQACRIQLVLILAVLMRRLTTIATARLIIRIFAHQTL